WVVLVEVEQVREPGEDERVRQVLVAEVHGQLAEVVRTGGPVQEVVEVAAQAQLFTELVMAHRLGTQIQRPDGDVVVVHPGRRVAAHRGDALQRQVVRDTPVRGQGYAPVVDGHVGIDAVRLLAVVAAQPGNAPGWSDR